MNELVTATINGTALPVKFWDGVPVVTFKDIDEVHQRPAGTAGRNFRKNRNRFEEGVDYYQISADEFRRLIGDMDIRHKTDVVLITEPGYLMLVKSFRDDLSWKVQRELVRFYFAARPAARGGYSQSSASALEDFAAAKAKVELVDSVIGKETCLGIRETAHRFGVTQMELVNFLSEQGYIVRSSNSGIWVPSTDYKDSGWFQVVHRVRMGQITPRPQTYITREGREKLYPLITEARLAGRLTKCNAREARGKENYE